MVRIELIKSIHGRPPRMRKTVQALGLRKLHSVVEFKKTTPALDGMIAMAQAVLKVEKINE